MHEERNVKWLLVISLIMIPVATFTGMIIYPSYPYRQPDALEVVSFYMNRIDVLCFIATMTIATLATTGFGSKALLSRITVYLFLISMTLFFISVLELLLTPPWVR